MQSPQLFIYAFVVVAIRCASVKVQVKFELCPWIVVAGSTPLVVTSELVGSHIFMRNLDDVPARRETTFSGFSAAVRAFADVATRTGVVVPSQAYELFHAELHSSICTCRPIFAFVVKVELRESANFNVRAVPSMVPSFCKSTYL